MFILILKGGVGQGGGEISFTGRLYDDKKLILPSLAKWRMQVPPLVNAHQAHRITFVGFFGINFTTLHDRHQLTYGIQGASLVRLGLNMNGIHIYIYKYILEISIFFKKT